MLKNLGIVVALILLQVTPLHPQTPTKPDDHQQNAQRHQNPESSSTIINTLDNHVGCGECSKKKTVPPQDPDKWVRRGFWINFGLVIITLVIAGTSFFQASAAKLSAKAVMLSERAWLLPDGEKIGMLTLIPSDSQTNPRKFPVACSIVLKNCGNTPAFAIKWEFELRMGESKEIPPSFDIYKDKSTLSMEGQTPFPIGPGWPGYAQAALSPQEYISTAEKAEIDAGTKHVWLCGIVQYRDVFEHRRFLRTRGNLHETKVCLRYMARSDGSAGMWVLGGPSGYNQAT
jgi:hypothetical protein